MIEQQVISQAHWWSGTAVSAFFAGVLALVLTLLFGRPYIRWMKGAQFKQVIRDNGPQSHLAKDGTPTMGGGLIVAAATISTVCFSDWHNLYVWLILGVLVATAILGCVDDAWKVMKGNTKGVSAKLKLFWQLMIAVIALYLAYHVSPYPLYSALQVPLLKTWLPALGGWYVVLGVFVILAASNAVNLTDGLDGLASMPVVFVLFSFMVFAIVQGNQDLSRLCHLPYLPLLSHVVVVIAALMGAVLGFLWFNINPAEIFMGDVGSLSLGAALGMIAVVVRQEILLIIMGGVFVAETVSVILQVASFRLRGKRIFKMAPLHHHFELAGWKETRVVMRFWWVSLLLVFLGLSTLVLG